MSTDFKTTILVLTDTPGIYGDNLNHKGKKPTFVKDIGVLLSQLKSVAMAGLVLEVTKVMKATRKERDRLFSYASNFPVLRTKVVPKHGFITYLDPKECFFNNLEAAIGKRCRNHERIPVNMECTFSKEDDPSMAKSVAATIFDISAGGCLIKSPTVFQDEQFIHLRIPQLSNTRPIYSSLRWTRPDDDTPSQTGIGVMFIDLADDQLEAINALQLTTMA